MKKILYSIIASIGIFGATSCSDMLETESSRLVSDPQLNHKTDSMFYALGVLEAMQELGDQYFFQNEMRGELVVPTTKATTHLKNLADFSAGAENKYDSVYRYYKVINNCNYYLQHRDTTLMTGTRNVTINEFVNIAALRAWTYLQLTTQYGDVPYITETMNTISQINATTQHTDYKTILAQQALYLETLKAHYTPQQLEAPVYTGYNLGLVTGHLNCSNGINKNVYPRQCFVPFNVVLGDLYLELGEYEKAAKCYYDYFYYQSTYHGITSIGANYSQGAQLNNGLNPLDDTYRNNFELPLDWNTTQMAALRLTANGWDVHLGGGNGEPSGMDEVLSLIPMAVNYTAGVTTDVPLAFGYDFYSSTPNRVANYRWYGCPETNEIQVTPSEEFNTLAYKSPFYYITTQRDLNSKTEYLYSTINGDGRANSISRGEGADSTCVFVQKPSTGRIMLYRNTTVWMHLAEALNRMGEPELAFSVLKSGINQSLASYVDTAAYVIELQEGVEVPVVKDPSIPVENFYIPKPSYDRLKSGDFPFLAGNIAAETHPFHVTGNKEIAGIRMHGAGAVESIRSIYSYKPIVEGRVDKIRQQFGLPVGNYTKEEMMNAVEDLLCDEYAIEFAFEGRRFSDLMRLARHKNQDTTYGAGFGDRWLADKLKNKASISSVQGAYLPFK